MIRRILRRLGRGWDAVRDAAGARWRRARRRALERGLAELVAWLSLATGEGYGVIDEERPQTVTWHDAAGRTRQATLPLVIFVAERGRAPRKLQS